MTETSAKEIQHIRVREIGDLDKTVYQRDYIKEAVDYLTTAVGKSTGYNWHVGYGYYRAMPIKYL